jgi:hypothetical protein
MSASYLTSQLRESAPYMKDAGWHQSAALILAAATEIERLRAELTAMESHDASPRKAKSWIAGCRGRAQSVAAHTLDPIRFRLEQMEFGGEKS